MTAPLIIDSFAGGGVSSTGIEMAHAHALAAANCAHLASDTHPEQKDARNG